jgi:hypothetical protein
LAEGACQGESCASPAIRRGREKVVAALGAEGGRQPAWRSSDKRPLTFFKTCEQPIDVLFSLLFPTPTRPHG